MRGQPEELTPAAGAYCSRCTAHHLALLLLKHIAPEVQLIECCQGYCVVQDIEHVTCCLL